MRITKTSDRNIKTYPSVGDVWSHNPNSARPILFIRIANRYGETALGVRDDNYFYSVNLTDFTIVKTDKSCTDLVILNAELIY